MPEAITDAAQSTTYREKIARTVTYFVLALTALITIGSIIIISGESGGTNEHPVDKFGQYKDVIAILLPLWGTWIGTVLAYYFSKDNFESANRSVQNLVNSITSDKKLESTKAKEIMIPVEKLMYKEYKTGTDDNSINLKTDFLDFVKEKGIQRVILLDENKTAKYVLHKSTIESFIAEQYFQQSETDNAPNPDGDAEETEQGTPSNEQVPTAQPTQPKTLTFADMKVKGNEPIQAILKNGVKFIKEDANLSDAKLLLKNNFECNDVFITKTGAATEPVLGWITNKTIAENSIVS